MDKTKLKSLLVAPHTTIKQSMQKLNETAEKIVFVVDEKDTLLGTVTDGNIRRGIIGGVKFSDSVETVMHKDFTAVRFNQPDMDEHIRRLMLENKFEQIPVLDDQGTIIDVVLWTDILGDKVKASHSGSLLHNQVVVMAGGKGTRLDPFTRVLPKPLIPIGNKPVIEVIMQRFYACGFHRFTYTLNYKKEYLKLFLKENVFPYTIDWVEEDEFLGTAGGLTLLENKITDTFFVTNCDSVLETDFTKVLNWHKEQGAAMTIIGCHNEVKIPFGVLELQDGRLHNIAEKPVQDIIINTGVYVMEPHVISYLTSGKQMDMNQLIDIIREKEKVSVYPICGGWFDIGQWEEYKRSVEQLGDTKNV